MHFDLSDQYRPQASAVHGLDPRVKVIAALAYILAVSLTQEGRWGSFGFYWLVCLGTVWFSRVGLFFTVRRSVVAVPFMLAALAIPFTTPGLTLWELPGLSWTISDIGVIRFASILARSWIAVQAAILLTAVTRFPDLLWALGALRFPRSLVSTIAFMYRYLFVLADETLRMRRARASRSARLPHARRRSVLWQGKVAGAMVGSLFLRALARSERVYAAMLSRGYDGQMRSLTGFQMRATDWSTLIAVGLLLAIPLCVQWMG